MSDLIERLEAASDGSRELDADIFIATAGIPEGSLIDRIGGCVGWWPPKKPYQSAREVPNYTASLDAALTLVPEGWKVNLRTERHASFLDFAAHAAVMDRDWPDPLSGDGSIVGEGHSETLPLALCIAALKARSA